MPPKAGVRFAERFWARVHQADGCWEWLGAHTGAGYGAYWRNGRMDMAHRISYELIVGPIPAGLQIDHLCRNRGCVNPTHLEPVTGSVNQRRSPITTGRLNTLKTHCPSGHPYEGRNLVVKADGAFVALGGVLGGVRGGVLGGGKRPGPDRGTAPERRAAPARFAHKRW